MGKVKKSFQEPKKEINVKEDSGVFKKKDFKFPKKEDPNVLKTPPVTSPRKGRQAKIQKTPPSKASLSDNDSSLEDSDSDEVEVIKRNSPNKNNKNVAENPDSDSDSDLTDSTVNDDEIPEGEELSEHELERFRQDFNNVESSDSDSDSIGEDEIDFDTLDQFYAESERAVINLDGGIQRISEVTRDLNRKIYNIDTEKDYDEDDPLQMPPTGILTDGIPFHHLRPYPLQEKHIRRLYAHGIVYRTSFFTHQEDRQLILNWKRYAKKFKIDFDDAPLYMGWCKHLDRESLKKIKQKIIETNLHAYMCVNLIDRCAIQVRRRCYRVFNPKDDDWKTAFLTSRKFTKEEDKRLLEMHNHLGEKWQEIAVRLKRNRFDVQKRYVQLTEGKYHLYGSEKAKGLSVREFTSDVLKELYDEVKNYMPLHPVQLIASGDLQKMAEAEDSVNWTSVGNRMKVFPDICREKWKEVKRKLILAYEKVGDSETAVSKVEKEVFPPNLEESKTRNLKMDQFQECLKILIDMAKTNEITELFEIDTGEFTQKIKDAGISFHTVLTYGSRILSICHQLLNILRRCRLLAMLPYDVTIVELLEMILFFSVNAKSGNLVKLRKNHLMQLMKDFLESKGYEPNPNYIIIYKEEIEKLKDMDFRNEPQNNDESDDEGPKNGVGNQEAEESSVFEYEDESPSKKSNESKKIDTPSKQKKQVQSKESSTSSSEDESQPVQPPPKKKLKIQKPNSSSEDSDTD